MTRDPGCNRGTIDALALLCCLSLLSGCAVGPNYKRPIIDSPAAFRAESQATNGPYPELAWWEVYKDETLQALIREALTNNYDLRIAMARVEQERALAMQARSQFVPSVNYNANVSRGRNFVFDTSFPNNGATSSSAATTLNAFWEVDLWGRVRRLNESARAQFLASEEARRGVRLTLVSDVATSYFQLLELDQEIEIASRTTNSFAESMRIFNQRVAGGTASGLESSRAEAAFDDASAAVPAIRQRISTTENQLSILLGRNPGPIRTPQAPALTEFARNPRRITVRTIGTTTGRAPGRATPPLGQCSDRRIGRRILPQNWPDRDSWEKSVPN